MKERRKLSNVAHEARNKKNAFHNESYIFVYQSKADYRKKVAKKALILISFKM